MFNNLHPKCANPSCASAFDWLGGGRLFRFHRETAPTVRMNGKQLQAANSHRVEHFWLCERCSHIYTLDYIPDRGVLIRPLWPELPAAEHGMHLPIA